MSVLTKIRTVAVLLTCLGLCAGCGSRLGDVVGRVEYDGQPVDGVNVFFVPENGPQAVAAVNETGQFRLETPGNSKGVRPGKYRVFFAPMVSEAEEEARKARRESDLVAGVRVDALPEVVSIRVPTRLQSLQTTDLFCEIVPGRNELSLHLDEHE